jgi:hypothetical protein
MKVKTKPLKAPPTPNDGPPRRGKIANTGSGLEATEFRGLKPEEYEAACVFEMIVDLSREDRRKIPADLQSVVRVVEYAENQPMPEGQNYPSWSRLDRNAKILVTKRTRGTFIRQAPELRTAASFITGDRAAFINSRVNDSSQTTARMPDTHWPLTLASGTTDPQTVALTIYWEAGLHRIKSEIGEWLEKNAPSRTPRVRPSQLNAHATGVSKADGNMPSDRSAVGATPDTVDQAAPAKGKSPYKKPAFILLRIAIRRVLRSGSKPSAIPNRVASKRVVDGARGNLADAYRLFLKVRSPDQSRTTG